MPYSYSCVVCGGKFFEGDDCKCNPEKYDSAMAQEPGILPIDSSKTVSDKMNDGFFLLNLTENDEEIMI